MASWSWRGTGRARPAQAAPPARRPAVGVAPGSSGAVPQQARPGLRTPAVAEPDVVEPDASTPARPPLAATGTAVPPSPDAHLRRALALAELSRLVLETD